MKTPLFLSVLIAWIVTGTIYFVTGLITLYYYRKWVLVALIIILGIKSYIYTR